MLVGAAGFLVQQHAYRIGELRAALPAASVLEPLAGTILGLTLFGERIAARDLGSCLVLAMAAVATIAGVWLLGRAPLLGGREVRRVSDRAWPAGSMPLPRSGRSRIPRSSRPAASGDTLRVAAPSFTPGRRPRRRCTIAAACAKICRCHTGR